MIRLELAGRQYPVSADDLVVGAGEDCTIRIERPGVEPHHAVIRMMGDGSVAVQPVGPAAEVRVNGVSLGSDPTPLLHGDRITVGGQDILVVEAAQVGSTQHINVADLAKGLGADAPPLASPAPAPPPPPPVVVAGTNAADQPVADQPVADTPVADKSVADKPVADTPVADTPEESPAPAPSGPLQDGRLVSLTDGREYAVGSGGVFFGRDATSDIVVLSGEVSRRHAQILPTPQGYVINDSSTNGTFVNDERIEGSRVLNRSDVIRIGADEFRFYASPVPAPEEAPPVQADLPTMETIDRPNLSLAPSPPPGTTPPPAVAPPGAAARLNNTMMGMPAFTPGAGTPPKPSTAPLATLLVRKGPLKGERFVITIPVANIGRADYNDIIVADESVSQAHAKLQRREDVWVVTDLGSTNGTLVDGERITEEMELSPGATIQFGEVPMLFDPTDETEEIDYQPGTKVLEALPLAPSAPPGARTIKADEPIPVRPAGPKIVASPSRSSGARWWLIVIAVLVAAAAAGYYFLELR